MEGGPQTRIPRRDFSTLEKVIDRLYDTVLSLTSATISSIANRDWIITENYPRQNQSERKAKEQHESEKEAPAHTDKAAEITATVETTEYAEAKSPPLTTWTAEGAAHELIWNDLRRHGAFSPSPLRHMYLRDRSNAKTSAGRA